MLTYSFWGWRHLRGVLERDPELARTADTGVLGMCDMAARAWANVEESDGEHMSSLAARSIRAMVVTMMTVMVTRRSSARWWRETAAEAFLRIVPGTQFLCLHRSCPDVVRAMLASSISAGGPAGLGTAFPVALLPAQLIQRISHLHEQLGYPHVSASPQTSPELTGPAAGRTGSGAPGRLGQREG